jgi:integrase
MVDVRAERADGSKVRDRKVIEGPESRARAWGDKRQAVLLGELHAPSPAPVLEPITKVLTVKEWAPKMERYYQRGKFSARDSAIGILRTHVVPHIGDVALDKVTRSVVDELESVWRTGGYTEQNKRGRTIKGTASKKSLNNRRMALLSMLNYAAACHDESGLTVVPCKIELAKVDTQKAPTWYELDVYDRVVSAASGLPDPRCLVVVLLGGDAGLRGGEMISLRWKDVNIASMRIAVNLATYERTTQDRVEDEVKGGEAKPVPVSERLMRALQKLHPATHEHVLHDAEGRPLSWRALTWLSERVEKAAGLPAKGLVHVLRHTFISHLVLAGVHPRAIQEMARHKDLVTTMKYMHLARGAKDDAMKKLEALRR